MPNTRIEFEKDRLAHVLSDRRLEVPPYQRSYAWKEEQVEAFWSDLHLALEGDASEYFMGTIVAHDDHDRSIVIDGQQRLSTTSLLLAAFRDAFSDRGDLLRAKGVQERFLASFDMSTATYTPRLLMNEEDRSFFQTRVVDGDAAPAELASHRRLEAAQEYLKRKVEQDLGAAANQWLERANRWISLLTERVTVIVILVDDVADGFVIFETLNDRGAPLTISDLLRNFLMSRAGEALDEVREAWSLVLTNLGLSEEESTFVDFFRQYWSSVHGATREKVLFTAIQKEIRSSAAVSDFVRALPSESRNYAALLDAKHEVWASHPEEVGASVGALTQLELAQYRPLALAVLDTFDDTEISRTFRALVGWAVRGLLASRIGGGVTERLYGRAAQGVRNGELRGADDVLRQLLPIVPTDRDFRQSFASASVSRVGVARYLLNALERDIRDITAPELVDDRFGLGFRLQVVAPKNADPYQWEELTEDELKSNASRLGNYVLLETTDKPVPVAASYSERRSIMFDSPAQLTRRAADFEMWSTTVIDELQDEMAAAAVRLWPRDLR